MYIFLNGKIQKADSKQLQNVTPGIAEGKGIFETMRIQDGEILRRDQHLQRLQRGLKRFGLRKNISTAFLEKHKDQLLRKNKLKHARARLAVWKDDVRLHVALVVQPLTRVSQTYRLTLSSSHRPLHAYTHLKCMEYQFFRNVKLQAVAQKYDDGLVLNRHRHIVEASTANIFWWKKDVLYTPSVACGCLNGVMRQAVIQEARQQGMRIQIGKYTLKHLQSAQACFVTNTLIGIRPVASLDKIRFQNSQLPRSLCQKFSL